MSELNILEYSSDISSAEAPPPLPVGEYPATIESVEAKTSATTGNDYLSVSFRIASDDFPADFDGSMYDNGLMLAYNRLVIDDNPRARYAMRKFCEAIGAKTGKQIDPNSFIGLNAKVKITHQSYEGEQRAQIAGLAAA